MTDHKKKSSQLIKDVWTVICSCGAKFEGQSAMECNAQLHRHKRMEQDNE